MPALPDTHASRKDLRLSAFLQAARVFEGLILLAFVLFPAVPIVYLALYQQSLAPVEAHSFHITAIAVSIAQSGLVAFLTWRCYLASGQRFLYWLSLSLIGFTVLYAPHGILTSAAHENPGLFLIFGPVSRVIFAVFLLVALIQYRRAPDDIRERGRAVRWLPWIVLFVAVDVAAWLTLDAVPLETLALRRGLETTALVLELVAAAFLAARGGRSPLLRMYLVATAYFAFSSVSFLISRPWDHQWWLAHLIFASGFLLVSLGVLRAYQTTKSFAGVYSQEEWVERLAAEKQRAESALAASEDAHRRLAESVQASEHLAAIVQSAEEAILSLSLEGTILSWNAAAERMLGYKSQEVVGQSVYKLIPAELRRQEDSLLARVRRSDPVEKVETRRLHKDGHAIDVRISKAPLKDTSGGLIGVASVWADISEAKRLQRELEAGRARLSQVLNSVVTGIVVHGPDTKIAFSNAEASRLLGLSAEQLAGRATIDPYWHFVREDGSPMPVEEFPVSIVMRSGAALNNYVVGVQTGPGFPTRWVLVNALPRLDLAGAIQEVIVSFVDISERKALSEELQRLANVDGLTSLATRRHFLELAERELARRARKWSPMAVLLLDVDHFKSINDQYGHPAGDAVLRRLAELVRMTIRDIDVAGRLGGEEFAVLLPDVGPEKAAQVADRIRKIVEATPVELEDGHELSLTVSIGIAQLSSAMESIAALLAAADRALYQAKHMGRNRVEIYATNLQ